MSNIVFPYNDLFVRYLLSDENNKDLLLSFINAVNEDYELPVITEVTIQNPFNLKSIDFEKETIIDVKAKDQDGHIYDIEVQVAEKSSFIKKSLYYWADIYSSQISEGENYRKLNPVICINLVNFDVIATDEVHSCFKLTEQNNPKIVLTNDCTIHYLELPKFTKRENFKTSFDRWLAFFRYEGKGEDEIMKHIIQDDPAIAKAHRRYEIFIQDQAMMELYRARKKWKLTHNTEIEEAREQGLEQGRQEGKQEGEKRGKTETAKNMQENGLPIEMIAKCTGLSIDEIKKLSN